MKRFWLIFLWLSLGLLHSCPSNASGPVNSYSTGDNEVTAGYTCPSGHKGVFINQDTGDAYSCVGTTVTVLAHGEFPISAYGCTTASSDNSTCIQAAIDAAEAVDGTVIIPVGTWKSDAISIPSNVSLEGVSSEGSILQAIAGVTTFVSFTGDGSSFNRQVRDVFFDGNDIATTIAWVDVLAGDVWSGVAIRNTATTAGSTGLLLDGPQNMTFINLSTDECNRSLRIACGAGNLKFFRGQLNDAREYHLCIDQGSAAATGCGEGTATPNYIAEGCVTPDQRNIQFVGTQIERVDVGYVSSPMVRVLMSEGTIFDGVNFGGNGSGGFCQDANCTGSGAPCACCTGSGTGTCDSDEAYHQIMIGNLNNECAGDDDGPDDPEPDCSLAATDACWECCSGSGTGDCAARRVVIKDSKINSVNPGGITVDGAYGTIIRAPVITSGASDWLTSNARTLVTSGMDMSCNDTPESCNNGIAAGITDNGTGNGKVIFLDSTTEYAQLTISPGLRILDAPLIVGDTATAYGTISEVGTHKQYGSATGSVAHAARVIGDAAWRWQVDSDGVVAWGNGTDALDANLYRSAADTLQTDDELFVVAGLTLGEDGTDGVLTIYADDATDYSTVFQPGTQTQDVTYTLPVDDGTSSQFLQTDGSGVLSWATSSGSGDVTNVFDCASGDCNNIAMAATEYLDAGAGFLEIPNGTAPVVTAADGRVALDTTDNQIIIRSTSDIVLPTQQYKCASIPDLATADEIPLSANPDGMTVTAGWCLCFGTCTTEADIVFSDDVGGTDMTGTITCEDTTTGASVVSVTADNTLAALSPLVADVTNTPNPSGSDEYVLCWRYTVTRE